MSPQNVVAGLVVSANLGCTFDQTVGCVSPSFLRFGDRTTRVIRSKGLDHYRYLGRTLGSVVIESDPTISHHRIWCGKIILRFLRVRSNVPLDVQLELTSHRSHLFASDLNEDVISLVVAPVRVHMVAPIHYIERSPVASELWGSADDKPVYKCNPPFLSGFRSVGVG